MNPRPSFEEEISADTRYEKGLAVKALLAVALVVIVLLARTFIFS
ncbi:MAG TPA: hypothetical protein VG253_00875 [Streptosporangiaceae bacterium]|jgi:hypothetical protein|nr:hypothetical protein [Streptosporangiaceae bacterium]